MGDSVNDFISNERRDFSYARLEDITSDSKPISLLHAWLAEAIEQKAPEPYAFTLSSLTVNGGPTSRIVYARKITEEGVVFYTNYHSRKGREFDGNAKVCALFYWPLQERQVRIEGLVAKVPAAESDAYFQSRPRYNQLSAWASMQSEKIASRKELEERMAILETEYKDAAIPRPPHWGGYLVTPAYYEFWQGRPGRLHDRVVFEKQQENWNIYRVSP